VLGKGKASLQQYRFLTLSRLPVAAPPSHFPILSTAMDQVKTHPIMSTESPPGPTYPELPADATPWPPANGHFGAYSLHCHCGAVHWTMKLSPPLFAEHTTAEHPERTAVNECLCTPRSLSADTILTGGRQLLPTQRPLRLLSVRQGRRVDAWAGAPRLVLDGG